MAKGKKLCIFNAHLVDESIDSVGMIVVDDGRILSVVQGFFQKEKANELAGIICSVSKDSVEMVDAQGFVLQPAFIDMHAHFRYPGQTEKEDLATGLQSAAAGGFGTLVLMPNTNPVVSSVKEAVRICQRAAEYNLADVFQSVSLTRSFDGTDTSHLEDLPVYTPGSSALDGAVPVATEDGRDVAAADVMLEAMKKCACKNVTVSCHCEDTFLASAASVFRRRGLELLELGSKTDFANDKLAYQAFEEANRILALAEDTATERNIDLACSADCSVHIAHVSTKNSIKTIERAKKSGWRVTCEVTPHHLGLSVRSNDPSLRHLVNPPLRSEADRQALLEALCNGTADVVATDHAPHTAQDKANGAPGFSGLETAYAICNTQLVRSGLLSASRLSALMSANPARILGLDYGSRPKGRLLPGYAADLVICDPDLGWLVEGGKFFSKGKYTPLEGRPLHGRILKTFYKGVCVFQDK